MLKKLKEKIRFGWLFCLVMILIFCLVYIFRPELGLASWQYLLNLTKKIAPLLLLVFALMFFSFIVLQPKTIIKYLGQGSGVKGWLIAVVGGIMSTGPIYMWYPLLADLKQAGTRNHLLATFIYSRAIKIPLMPILLFYFSLPFVIILTVYLIIFSFINGIIVGKIINN